MSKDSKEKGKFWTYAKPVIFVIVSLCALGITFSFPFIRFSNKIRIFMLILWLLAIIYVWIQVVRVDKIKRQKEQKIKQDKLVYIWSIATAILSFSSILLFSFLNHSFNTNFNVITLPIGISVLMICLFSVIISVAENKKEFFKGLGKILLYSFLLTLLTTGLMIKNEPNLTDIQRWASLIAIALGAIPLLAISILWISKILSDDNNSKIGRTIKHFALIIVIIVLLILIPILITKAPIKNKAIAEALITVFASVAGGSLTLIGVLFEIKYQSKVKKEEWKEQNSLELKYIQSFDSDKEKYMYLRINFEGFSEKGYMETIVFYNMTGNLCRQFIFKAVAEDKEYFSIQNVNNFFEGKQYLWFRMYNPPRLKYYELYYLDNVGVLKKQKIRYNKIFEVIDRPEIVTNKQELEVFNKIKEL